MPQKIDGSTLIRLEVSCSNFFTHLCECTMIQYAGNITEYKKDKGQYKEEWVMSTQVHFVRSNEESDYERIDMISFLLLSVPSRTIF